MANYDLSSGAPSYPSFTEDSTPTAKRPTHAPFIDVPSIHNFRGLTGVQSKIPTGRRIRWNYLFRSAEPSTITPTGISVVQNLGIKRIYDFRSGTEIERNKAVMPVADIPGTTRVFSPVFGPADAEDHHRRMNLYGQEGTEGFAEAYAEILVEGQAAYRNVFDHIRDRPDEPLLVHCTAGKDRTGVVAALVLDLVGVEKERIGEDYALTEEGLAEWFPKIRLALMSDPALGGDETKVDRMISARKENMVAFLERVQREWNGAEGYLRKGLGYSDEDIGKIRHNVTEPI